MKILLLLIISILLSQRCSDSSDLISGVYVDISKPDKNVSISDLFEKIELIPLETTDESLLKRMDVLRYQGNKYFILDKAQHIVFIFDEKGKFINKLDKRGEGPDEYFNLMDILIKGDTLEVLASTNRAIYSYHISDLSFIERKNIPDIPRAYCRFMYINPDLIAFWTYDYDNRLKYYSISADKIVYESFKEKDLPQFSISEFETSILGREFTPEVYELKESGEEVYFRWDFGDLNQDVKNIKEFDPTASMEDHRKQAEDMMYSRSVNYILTTHFRNSRYQYVRVGRNYKLCNLFYDKESGESFYFEKTKENLALHPFYFGEEFILGCHDDLHDVINESVLSEADKYKLSYYNPDIDNPCLIKYTFK